MGTVAKKPHRSRTDQELNQPVQITIRQYQHLHRVRRCHDRLTYFLGMLSHTALPPGGVGLMAELLDVSHNENVKLNSADVLDLLGRFRELLDQQTLLNQSPSVVGLSVGAVDGADQRSRSGEHRVESDG